MVRLEALRDTLVELGGHAWACGTLWEVTCRVKSPGSSCPFSLCPELLGQSQCSSAAHTKERLGASVPDEDLGCKEQVFWLCVLCVALRAQARGTAGEANTNLELLFSKEALPGA